MENQSGEWLPVGSVVEVAGAEEPLRIFGYLAQDVRSGAVHDYLGYPHPSGMASSDEAFLFDRGDIVRLRFVGYQNGVWDELAQALAARRD